MEKQDLIKELETYYDRFFKNRIDYRFRQKLIDDLGNYLYEIITGGGKKMLFNIYLFKPLHLQEILKWAKETLGYDYKDLEKIEKYMSKYKFLHTCDIMKYICANFAVEVIYKLLKQR